MYDIYLCRDLATRNVLLNSNGQAKVRVTLLGGILARGSYEGGGGRHQTGTLLAVILSFLLSEEFRSQAFDPTRSVLQKLGTIFKGLS